MKREILLDKVSKVCYTIFIVIYFMYSIFILFIYFMYKKTWTQFETQSLAFGLLRKALFPKYLVRGDLGTIKVYQPTADSSKPELLFTIYVTATDSEAQSHFTKSKIEPKAYILAGGNMAWNVVELVSPLL